MSGRLQLSKPQAISLASERESKNKENIKIGGQYRKGGGGMEKALGTRMWVLHVYRFMRKLDSCFTNVLPCH